MIDFILVTETQNIDGQTHLLQKDVQGNVVLDLALLRVCDTLREAKALKEEGQIIKEIPKTQGLIGLWRKIL